MTQISKTAARVVLDMVTDSFYVPLDAHHVLVARDTRENRQQFTRQEFETVYLPGLSPKELTDVVNLAKNVFNATAGGGRALHRDHHLHATAKHAESVQRHDARAAGRAKPGDAGGAHDPACAHQPRNTGVQPPQSMSAFNVYAEEQSILNANQSLVQQIISSGLAAPGDTLAILGILLASGQISSSLFSNGIALFGGGLTQSALSPGSFDGNLNLNSSDSRELDQIQLRLGDGEDGEH